MYNSIHSQPGHNSGKIRPSVTENWIAGDCARFAQLLKSYNPKITVEPSPESYRKPTIVIEVAQEFVMAASTIAHRESTLLRTNGINVDVRAFNPQLMAH